MSKNLVAIPEQITRDGVFVCGVISKPGEKIEKEGTEKRFRLRIATGGDQVHVPTFMTVTFYGDYCEEASREVYLYKELSPIVVHGRLTANASKDGRRAFIELSADGVKPVNTK